MGKLSLKDKVCIFISWALVLVCSAAEREYFSHDWRNLTWDGARNHCQVCFKELVTLTPENIQTISKNLTSDCWVGLRKSFLSTSNMSWSHWADGQPLIYQNWYPGWPVFKSSSPKRYCCSCSCECAGTMTTPATTPGVTNFSGPGEGTTASDMSSVTDVTDPTVTDFTGFWESTTESDAPTTPAEAECRLPILMPDVPETDDNYIEDSCVAMLSFGAWVEKSCSETLPFICYEDRFFGQANVTNTTSESATLTWLRGPGDISHYRVEVTVDKELTHILTDNLTCDLVNLRAGAYYSVRVFPVKCQRELNPQEIAFYTTPNKVEKLRVINVTETSIFLSWNTPAGNVSFYLIEVQGGGKIESNTEGAEVGSLIPGKLYTITVLSGVLDKSVWSEESRITKNTKPGKVSHLRVSENTNNSLLLNWVLPEGIFTGFWVKAMKDNNDSSLNQVNVSHPDDENVTQMEVRVTGLPMGTKITLSVAALTANGTLEGDRTTVVSYTAPGLISDITLVSTQDSITATWKSSMGDSSFFTVALQLDGENVETIHNVTEPRIHFNRLKTAANYTLIFYSFSGHIKGPTVQYSMFTRPSPPTKVNVISSDENQITFQWSAPHNIWRARYSVRINSSFWGQSWSDTLDNKNSHTFGGLKSGTRYDFEVRTVADRELSNPAAVSHCTDAKKREISLSMLCSSAESLLCDNNTTRENVFHQLHTHFNELLGDRIFWKLEKQETENKGTQ